MPDVAALNVTITADTRDLESGVARAEKSVAGLGATMSSVLTGIGVGVGMKAFDGIVSGFEAAGKAAIGFNSNMEQSTIAFTSMLGSAEKAQAFLDEMKQFAATTPFEFPDLLQASKQMMAFGFAAKDVKPLLTSVGSAAAAMGTGRSGVDSITKALGQMRAATVVQAGELNQLTEQGVPAFQILADAMGISTGEVKKLASEGKIASDVFITAFQTWADAKYGDMMGKQALTFEGAMSNIKDSLTFAVAEGAKPFFEAISAGAVTLSQFVQSDTFTAWAKSFADTARDAFRQVADGVRTVQQVLAGDWAPADSIEPFALAVGNAAVMLRDTFGPAVTAVAGFVTGTLIPSVQAFAAPIAAFIAGFSGALVSIGLVTVAVTAISVVLGALLSPIGLVAIAVGALAAAWTTNFMGIQEATAAAWAYLLPIFTQIVDWLGPKISAVLTWLTTTGWPMMLAAAQAVGEWITTVAIPALTDLIAWLGPKLSAVVTWITDTGWPGLVTAATAVSDWITGTAVPAFTELVSWIGEKTSAVVTWLTSTGWPGLVTAGEKVWAVVQEIIRFFKELYVELDKREVFTTLARLWDELVLAGGKVWEAIKKMDEIFRPFQQLTAEFNSGPGKVLVETFGQMGTSGEAAGKGIDIVAVAAKAMGTVFETALFPLKNFLQNLKDLGELIERAKGWTLPSWLGGGGGGGGSGGGGIGTMSFRPGGGTPDEQITRAALQRGYDPAALISYARHETGNYSSGLYERANNLFSLKGTGPAGSVQMKDDEPGLSTFRAYNSIEEAINDFMDVIERQYPDVAALKGSPDKMFSALQGKGWATDPNWAANVLKGRSTVSVPNVGAGLGDIKISQAQWGASVGMTPQEAAAACGPYAAALFAQATGRMPNPAEAERLARAAGWTEAGMGGTGNFMKLLGSMGVNAVRTNTAGMSAADITAMASNAGSMTGFSTPGHYFASTGFDPASGKFNVGATGTFAGGSTWMTVSEMTALMGPIQDIITLGGQMGAAFTTGGKQVTDGVGIIPPAIATAGAAVTTFGETTATTAAGVVANTNLMASGALTSVTAMETGILTTVQTTAGTTIATVTDMQGQVTSQYATLANGATLTMGDMAAGVMTSTTDLGTGVMTTVQDMSGNYITTITDLSGNVTAQYTQLAADAVAQTAVQSTGVQAETATMAENVLTSVTDMGDGVITTVTDTNGQTTATVRDMSGKVTSQYSTMSTQSSGAVTRLAQTSVEQFGNIAEGARKPIEPINGLDKAMGSIKPPNLSSVVREFDKVTDAAKRAASAMDKVADKGGNKSAKEFAKKAAGGPVSGMTPYLVGEQGPELFMPATNGTIIPNNRLGGGGAVVYQVTVNVNGALLANNRMIEEAVVQGLDSARRRGREA